MIAGKQLRSGRRAGSRFLRAAKVFGIGNFLLAVLLAGRPAAAGDATVGRWIPHPSSPFDILATEATVEDFLACAQAGHCTRESADSKCNVGDAGRALHPVNCIDHDGAAALCSHLGGRLCTSGEWLSACRGMDARAFPYGNEFQPSRCHVGSYEHPGPGGRSTVPVGSAPECEGGLGGVLDLGGNVSEWVADCKGDYCKFRGAAYVGNEPVEYFAGCGDVCSGNDKGLKSGTVGVRCCRDRAAPGAASR
jgi:formylglycine-generating enzyme required for sulfatase activity